MALHPAERDERLWIPVLAPAIWATYFTLCSVTAALWCGDASPVRSSAPLRLVVGIYSVVAMAGISALFLRGLRRHRHQWPDQPNDDDTPEDRRRFVAFTTMLLAGMSLLATAYVWLAVAVVHRCPS